MDEGAREARGSIVSYDDEGETVLQKVRYHDDEYAESYDGMHLSSGTLMLASSSWVS